MKSRHPLRFEFHFLHHFLVFTVVAALFIPQVHAQVVDIPDPNLETAIREALNLPDANRLTQPEILRLTRLSASKMQIKDLTGLEYATNLTELSLHQNSISNLRSLAGLIRLKRLSLWGNPISDLSPLANLTELTGLDLGACQISDIGPLANLTQLGWLHLHYNQISNITSLTKLTQLTDLWLQSNQISDITPLAGLTQLTELALSHNHIVDVSPLASLENLMDLKLTDNPIRDFSPLLESNIEDIDIDIHMLQELASVEVEISDPNLKEAITEKLQLPKNDPVTQQDMSRLTGLSASRRRIERLDGLEYAVNLVHLSVWGNRISDLTPLRELVKLQYLDLAANQISDIAPLAGLTALTRLNVGWNEIVDVSPLANLKALRHLRLNANRIVDVSPLTVLAMLEELHIEGNFVKNLGLLDGLSLTYFTYDEICELPRLPIRERIQTRSFPSVFKAWHSILNRPTLSREDRVAHHDLFWSPSFGLHWQETDQGIQLVGNVNSALQERDILLDRNSNMLFLFEIRMRDAFVTALYHADWPYWVRDAGGNRVSAASDYSAFLVDFTHPDMQNIIVQQAIAVAKCGLYDGIFLDWWKENHAVLADSNVGWSEGYRGFETEQRARDNIIQRIRAEVGEDFLIIVNPNRSKPLRAGSYINGLFMETLRDYDSGYTHNGLIEIENTLLWAEENLREPQVNSLEGWGVETEAPDSPTNHRWMRVFTTMGLTHSDGYVLYITGIRSPNHEHDWSTFERTHAEVHDRGIIHNHHHDHYWYPFWDANLGKPIGPKAQFYQNVEGLFVREFTNGWAVYNRSGAAQTITLPSSATPVSDRGNNAASLTHLLPDLDGEIYLATKSFADVNGDGSVDILDLIQVTNSLGKSTPDPNGDGVIDILDLVFVTEQFSQ